MKYLRLATSLVFLGATAATITPPLNSQSTTGSIYGAVSDATGASVPGAKVTIKDVRTGVLQTATTNSSGEYTFTTVNPGDFTVTGEAAGFKSETETGVSLSANQNVHVTFSLVPGNVSETVQVEAGATQVDTRESQLAETIEQSRIEDLPTLNRQVYDLATTTPGVTNYTADIAIGSRNGANFSVNGLPTDATTYYIDGAYNDAYKAGGGNKVPNPDALQEFRLVTSNFDAEFGRAPGGVANFITRGGTSSYHGSAYEYLRNNMFNAKNYFATTVTPLHQNQFGATFGGPVPILPKTFFFLSWEQLKVHTSAFVTAGGITLPTPLELTGDFRQSAVKPNVSCNGVQAVLCQSAFDPVAVSLIKFLPATAAQQTAEANSLDNQGLARVDYNAIQNHSIEAMFFTARGTADDPTAGGNQILSYSGMHDYENQENIVLADNWVVSPRVVNTLRGFYTKNEYIISNLIPGHFLADLGSMAAEGGPSYAPPKFTVNGYFVFGPNGAGPSDITQLAFGLIDTANLTRGRHAIKLGGSYVWSKYSEDGGNSSNGIFTFTGSGLGLLGTPTKVGNPVADFLAGKANNLSQTNSVRRRQHNFDPALFAQDDWQVSKRLTLNLGVRWEVYAPYLGDTNQGTFVPGQQSTKVPQAPIGIVYPGDNGITDGIYNTSYRDFSPRVGFAYDVFGDGRTSLRGGYGLFFYQQQQFYSPAADQPYGLIETVAKPPNLVNPYGVGMDPYPYNPAKPTFVSGGSFAGVPVGGASVPYTHEYNLTVEQQLTPTFAMRLAYVGNNQMKNYISLDVNAPVYVPGAAVTTLGINLRRPYQPYEVNGAFPTPAAGTYNQFSAINEYVPADNGHYNSLQATMRGRVGTKFNMLMSYVWSKDLNYDGPTVENRNLKLNYGPSGLDIRHRFVASYVYHLPETRALGVFGREALNGWQINEVTSLQSGTNFIVTSGADNNLDGTSNDRVNVIGDPYTHAKTRQAKIAAFINPASFASPTGPYGNEQKNSLVGPATINTNLSLFKEFAIYRESRLQFRAEAFNAFGNVNLGNPRTNLSVFSALTASQTQITSAGSPRILQFAAKVNF